MKKWAIVGAGLLVIVAAIAVWRAEATYLSWLADRVDDQSLKDRQALIESGVELHIPEDAEGPAPVVLMFHGCAGPRMAFQRQWAKVMNEQGFAALIVDSTGPRGYSREEALATVCEGQALLGQERAGDVLAAYEIVRADQRLDASRVILAGWSHGAWTVMDFLTMDMERFSPAGLSGDLAPINGIGGVVLFYPYCGVGTLSRLREWAQRPPSLALIAGSDEVVDGPECAALLEKRASAGYDIQLTVYQDANHVFDDPFLEPDWIHWYDEKSHRDAEAKVRAFIDELDF
jgi:dienelactone hydrolase